MEIEKKFLINAMPENIESYERREIEQGYLNRSPTLRIRRSNDDYILTYKRKLTKTGLEANTLVNEEIEAELTEEAYLHLKEKIDGHLISKTRYIIPLGTCGDNCPGAAPEDAEKRLKIELDVFHGSLEGLIFAEVEFPSVDAAERFERPDWLGADVSADRRLRNGYLSILDDIGLISDVMPVNE